MERVVIDPRVVSRLPVVLLPRLPLRHHLLHARAVRGGLHLVIQGATERGRVLSICDRCQIEEKSFLRKFGAIGFIDAVSLMPFEILALLKTTVPEFQSSALLSQNSRDIFFSPFFSLLLLK